MSSSAQRQHTAGTGGVRVLRAIRTAVIMAAAVVLIVGASTGVARAQRAKLHVDRTAYAGLPFVIGVVVEGFDETPTPEQPPLAIADCAHCVVTPLGVEPQVSTSLVIDNGRRTQTRVITYVLRYQVQVEEPGTYEIPPLTVAQGGKRARSPGGRIQVQKIDSTTDMQLRLTLPARPVWVGEAVPVHIDWFVRKEVRDQQIIVPLFGLQDSVRVAAPEANGRNTLTVTAGTATLELPIEQTKVQLKGKEFVRVRLTALLTPIASGQLAIPASAVVAKIKTGVGRDRFGFPTARTRLFKAADEPRTLEVKALPLSGRPASFSGAVGTAFSIDASASRSVVKLGEPVELTLVVRSDSSLEGLSLPPLARPDALDPAKFSVPSEPPVGVVLDAPDGTPGATRAKEFKVTIQLKDPSVTEIPALPFSYFDPTTGTYHTVRSQAIAMRVDGAAIVASNSVVSARGAGGGNSSDSSNSKLNVSVLASRGADLGLSAPSVTMKRVRKLDDVRKWLYLLYAIPLLLLVGRLLWNRIHAKRSAGGARRGAEQRIAELLKATASKPARESVGALVTALRDLARATANEQDARELIEALETEAFAPSRSSAPLSEALRESIREHSRRWSRKANHKQSNQSRSITSGSGNKTTIAALLMVLAIGVPASARAAVGDAQASGGDDRSAVIDKGEATLDKARAAYNAALSATDREQKAIRFGDAAQRFRALVRAPPNRPELLTDWGNAALGSGDLGHATLAFRRALAIDPGNERARTNLMWVRKQQPSWLPIPSTAGAVDALFFWHRRLTVGQRHLLGAAAFALMILLLTPWSKHSARRRFLRKIAVLPALVWFAMLTSALLEPDLSADAVVIADDGALLRSADNTGAPTAMSNPLPPGTEVRISGERSAWVRVALSDGTKGWLPASAIERIMEN